MQPSPLYACIYTLCAKLLPRTRISRKYERGSPCPIHVKYTLCHIPVINMQRCDINVVVPILYKYTTCTCKVPHTGRERTAAYANAALPTVCMYIHTMCHALVTNVRHVTNVRLHMQTYTHISTHALQRCYVWAPKQNMPI